MIILFTLDGNDTELKFPLSCSETATVHQVIALLRVQLRAGSTVSIDIRNNQGMPISPVETMIALAKRQNNQKKSFAELYALIDGPRKAVQLCLMAAVSARRNENPGVSEEFSSGCEEEGPEGDDDDRRATLEDDPRMPVSNVIPGLHFIKINGSFQKAYALDNVSWGGPIAAEIPLLSLVYPTQMAEAVMANEKLRTRTFDPNFAIETQIQGVPADTFSKVVSIARTYGHLLRTKDKYGTNVALYPELSCLRHSCSPNAVFRRSVTKPYRGVVRCASSQGVLQGDEVTVLLPKVNTLLFVLMPRERRQKALQARYHFTCECARCWKESDDRELSLSGAFFSGEAENNAQIQKRLTQEMHDEFDALNVFNATATTGPIDVPSGPKIAKNPQELLQFIAKYTKGDCNLKLHRNHWRLSVARLAYLRQADFVLTSMQKTKAIPVRPFLEQRSFEVALHQMTTEHLFVPKGHPFYTSTFLIYRKMMAVLPANLAASLQAKSRKFAVDWDAIMSGHHLWHGRVLPLPASKQKRNQNETSSDDDYESSEVEKDEAPAKDEAGDIGDNDDEAVSP